jgi:excinuclease UvrABC nuclease subunit
VKIPEPVTLLHPAQNPANIDLAEFIAALPDSSGIYAFSVHGRVPHFSWSINLKRRLKRLLVSSRDGMPPLLRGDVDFLKFWLTGSRLEISLLMYELAKLYNPSGYAKQLRLRLPWFVGLTSLNAFPRIEVRNRLPREASRNTSAVFGPFFSRDAAQRYEQEVLSLFQLRRCTDVLEPHPTHPGCIYGEMNQCLRPCQCAVTPEEYAGESARVLDFLTTNGQSSATSLSVARQKASADLDFELAAQLHKRLERVNAAASSRDTSITSVNEFNGVALTPASGDRQFRLWPMLAGYWQEPVPVDLSSEASRARSLDREIRELLEASLQTARNEGRRAEHFALFSRWYHSSWRDGHWFPFHTLEDLNYRKLVRELSKMAASAKAAN